MTQFDYFCRRRKKRLGPYAEGEEKEESQINAKLSSVIFEVLQAMGRQADYEPLKEVLQQHMITTQDDLMVLTKDVDEEYFVIKNDEIMNSFMKLLKLLLMFNF